MFIYLFLIVFVISLSFLSVDKRLDKRYYVFFTCVFFVMLAIIAGTRLNGYDWKSYGEQFLNIPALPYYHRSYISVEIGYEWLVSLYKVFNSSFNGFLFFYAALTLFFAVIVSFRYSPYPLVSLAMFFSYAFFFQVMGQMRQPFAILLLYLFLIPALLKKRYLWAFILIVLATVLLHKACCFALGIFIFRDKILSVKQVLFVSLCALVLYVLSSQMLQFMLLLLPKSFYLYDAIVAYSTYNATEVSFTLGMVERIGMFFVLYYFGMRYNVYQTNRLFRLFVNFYFMGICIYFSFISVAAEFASRGTFFYVYSLFYAMPMLISQVPLRKAKYALLAITLLWSVYLATGIVRDTESNQEYIPYRSILL